MKYQSRSLWINIAKLLNALSFNEPTNEKRIKNISNEVYPEYSEDSHYQDTEDADIKEFELWWWEKN